MKKIFLAFIIILTACQKETTCDDFIERTKKNPKAEVIIRDGRCILSEGDYELGIEL